MVGGFLAGWLFFSSALMAVERRGGWGGVARRRERGGGRAEAEAVAGCRGSGRYLVNDYSLARRRCQAWNTRSCLRCSACCCCRPCYCPRIRVRGLDTVPPGSLSLPCIRGMLAVAHGMVLHACPCNRGCKQFRPARGQHRRMLRMRRRNGHGNTGLLRSVADLLVTGFRVANSELIRGKGEASLGDDI